MPATAATASAGPVPRGYRPWLDGVRAVAITLVLARHLGFGWARHAGGPGVALFFALSGYLITGLLLDERAKRHGRVDLAAFYVRRAARLLPALIVMLVASDLWFALHGRRGVVTESLSVLFYVKNYRDVIAGGHGLYGQAWSLAVEEHFYLLWPAALLVMAARWRRRRVIAATLALAGVAVLWRVALMLLLGPGQLLYVETFARADGLLVGCALAVAVRAGLRVPCEVTGLCIAVYAWVVSPLWHPQAVEQTIGYAVQATCGALIVAGLDSVDSPLRRALSTRPVVLGGVLSYGIYLWHISVLTAVPLRGGLARDALAVTVTVALAAASYRFVERPLRVWARGAHLRWRERRTAAAGPVAYPAGGRRVAGIAEGEASAA